MKKADFLNTDDFIFAQTHKGDVHHGHHHHYAHVFGLAYDISDSMIYYEWVDSDKKWVKIYDEDPDPPESLNATSPGEFDGQLIEIPKSKLM